MNELAEKGFAAAMQELSTQAAAVQSPKADNPVTSGISVLLSAVHSLNQRLEALEEMTMRNFEAMQFQKLEAQLAAMREGESVNQKLFDSLHEELISYRDSFMRESLQKPFIRDLLVLFDDLRAVEAQLDVAAPNEADQAVVERAHGNLHNSVHFLLEILRRLEVTEVEEKETVDLSIHRVISFEPTDSPEEDGQILRRIRRGFTWRGKLLRPEEVVAKRVR
jgi:molecular chaperone GrpE (heat shock protein)